MNTENKKTESYRKMAGLLQVHKMAVAKKTEISTPPSTPRLKRKYYGVHF